MRHVAAFVVAVFACNRVYECGSLFMRQVRGEGIRQRNISQIATSRDYCFEKPLENWEYVVKNRLLLDGASCSSNGTDAVEISWPLVFSGPRLVERDESVRWSKADGFPSPVWSRLRFKEGGGR
jgi:hypothetical protein